MTSRRILWIALLVGAVLALAPSLLRQPAALTYAAQTAMIQVLDGTTVVPNSGGVPGLPIDFPSTTPGVPVVKDFTVNNMGTADLFMANLLPPTGFSAEFVGSGTSASVTPGNSATLRITCLAATPDTYEGLVSFNTTDPSNVTFTFTIRCVVAAVAPPAIAVTANSTSVLNGQTAPVTFSPTFINTPVNLTVTLTNTGAQPLNVSNLSVTGGVFSGSFNGGASSITIQPSNSSLLALQCLSASGGTFDGTVTFTTNDPANTTFTFPIRCSVSGAGPDIEVLLASTLISNNQPTPVSLGIAATGSVLQRQFTIRNIGTANLDLTGLVIDPSNIFQGNFSGTSVPPNQAITLNVACFSQISGTFTGSVTFQSNDPDESPFSFFIQCTFEFQTPTSTLDVTATATATATGTAAPTGTISRTPIPTVILPTSFLTLVSPTPSLVPTFTPFPTFVFTPFQRTPLPAPACARQAPGIPRTGVVVLANRDGVNVRTLPAIGAPVIGFVNAGYTAEAEARSGDSQWVRVQLGPGQEGWIGLAVLTVLEGSIESLPVADPRTIPYGGFEAPRAGLTEATSPVTGRLAQSGLRIRSGPSTNYAILANAPRYSVMPVLGRTDDNRWVQVNFEGTLGWAATEFFEFSSADVFNLPIDGICADAVPLSDTGDTDFFDTLRLLLARLDLAQPSLDAIRSIWTNVALGGVAQCGNYPIRPTDYNIPQALLAAYFDRLSPIGNDFNTAMGALRGAIELLIEACQFPQPSAGSVGQATVQQALDAINLADSLFASLRRRITELLPPDQIGEDECLFVYRGSAAVVKRLDVGQPRNAQITTRPPRYVVGFCFDAPAGQSFRIELLRLSGSAAPRITISAFDNPTDFIAQQNVRDNQEYASVQPILIPRDGRYLVLVSDLGLASAIGSGDFVILLTNVTGVTFAAPSLSIDPLTGQILVNPVPQASIPQQLQQPGQPNASVGTCPNITFTCQQLLDCNQAIACFLAGNTTLDNDADGVPCENLCAEGARPTLDPNQ
jgi:uncharacterized protein YraI